MHNDDNKEIQDDDRIRTYPFWFEYIIHKIFQRKIIPVDEELKYMKILLNNYKFLYD